MSVTEKVYPQWVQEYRTKGTTVKKKGNAYYLYKRTSKRVPGKKYPQPVDTYIGIIILALIVTGLGFSLFSSPNTNAVMSQK